MKLQPFQLERYFARFEFKAPYLFCCSDCESLSIEDLINMEPSASDAFSSLGLGYTESAGSFELRQQIATLYHNINVSHILVHSGAEEAIFNFMNIVLNPGDEIVVHSPHYQSLGEVANGIGVRVIEWHGDPKNNWVLDIEELSQMVSANTRVVVVNFPHNPTGFLPNTKFLTELSQLSDRLGFIVFCDEVYRGLEYEKKDRLPAFVDMNNRGVSLGVMSKTYGLAGLRIGWIATRNEDLMDELAKFKDYTTICNSAPSEFLATLALKNRRVIVDRNIDIIKKNLNLLELFFEKYSDFFDWHMPKAGPIAFPKYLRGPVEPFCNELRNNVGVLLLPGTLFGDENNCFRIGFGRKNGSECIAMLEEYIKGLR